MREKAKPHAQSKRGFAGDDFAAALTCGSSAPENLELVVTIRDTVGQTTWPSGALLAPPSV